MGSGLVRWPLLVPLRLLLRFSEVKVESLGRKLSVKRFVQRPPKAYPRLGLRFQTV